MSPRLTCAFCDEPVRLVAYDDLQFCTWHMVLLYLSLDEAWHD